VRHRESYSHIGAEYAWKIVSAMSDERTRKEYQAEHDPTNAESPYKRYGDRIRVEVGYDSHWSLCPVEGCGPEPEGYQFRFQRTEVVDGIRQPPVMYVAQARFRRRVQGIDPAQLYTFNAPGVQVWEYVRGTPAGAQPSAQQGSRR
jgi:VirB8 protein